MRLLVALCRWTPYTLLALLAAVLVLDVPISPWLIVAAVLACFALLLFLAWLGRDRSSGWPSQSFHSGQDE